MTTRSPEHWMRRALELAERARGRTSPNPMVGAVIVRNGRVVGEGYHRKAGGPHAEIVALRQAGERARGASLYLNLEPCCHHGRTPPCTEVLLQSGLEAVYVGMRDPNPKVAGRGLRQLRRAGIAVHQGILREACERLNEAFRKYIVTGRPFVILKSALSLDGKIATATGESQWITGPAARRQVHRLRNGVDAILVGAGTVLRDDPQLTTRLGAGGGRHPVRVILDNEGLTSAEARVYAQARGQKVIHVTSKKISSKRLKLFEKKGVAVCPLPERAGLVSWPHLMALLGEMELTSLLIEGGGRVNGSALRAGVVDKIVWFLAPRLIGGEGAHGVLGGAGIRSLRDAVPVKRLTVTPVGPDWMMEGYL